MLRSGSVLNEVQRYVISVTQCEQHCSKRFVSAINGHECQICADMVRSHIILQLVYATAFMAATFSLFPIAQRVTTPCFVPTPGLQT